MFPVADVLGECSDAVEYVVAFGADADVFPCPGDGFSISFCVFVGHMDKSCSMWSVSNAP